MIDLSDPTLDERLQRRTADGRYELGECELVANIRALRIAGNMAGVRRLCEVLLQRCAPVFQRYTQGLRHRPELREEAIANMAEHLLREVQDPTEVFMTKNFIHYLRCLCADEFNRILRQEGLHYRRDDEGRPTGRPQHVPRSLVEPLQAVRDDGEGQIGADVADPDDQYEAMHAGDESQRILMYLQNPLDRKIMVLRVLEEMKWDDVATLCERTERTVRLRFERARRYLRECVAREQDVTYHPKIYQQQ
jgi:DNA-directed RNA polymerase specialized sigma24 family protein